MKRLSLLFFLLFFTSQVFAGPIISPTAPSKVIRATSVTATGNIQASTYGSGANPIPDATLLGIDDGLTTQILVGGGGNTKPEWGTDLPTAVTIGTKYIYRADGTDVPVADGGTGASTLTDGGVLLGSGTGAVTVMPVLTDGQIIVGDGTTDPVAESGDTARISLGVGSTDSPTFVTTNLTGVTDNNIPKMGASGFADSAVSDDGSGNVAVQSGTDSTTGFQVKDADGGTPVLNVDTDNENVYVSTSDMDGTPAIGKLTVKGSTNDGSTNILVGRDSDEANVFSFDTDGYIKATGMSISNNDNGTSNTIFGKNAGLNLDIGSNYNVFIGENVSDAAMDNATSNVGIGLNALGAITTADSNIGIGENALKNLTGASGNVAIGQAAQGSNETGSHNIAFGYTAMYGNIDGSNNFGLGNDALRTMTTGDYNIAIGSNAGYKDITNANVTEADNSVIIGVSADFGTTTPTNEIVIGYDAQGAGDNTTTIGNSSTTDNYFFGNTKLSTADTDVIVGDKLGQIDFWAPKEASGTDAILPGASIWAVAESDFAADSNATSLVFATGSSEAAAAKMTILSDGRTGIRQGSPTAWLEVNGSTEYPLFAFLNPIIANTQAVTGNIGKSASADEGFKTSYSHSSTNATFRRLSFESNESNTENITLFADGIVTIGTQDRDGTPAIGRTVIKGSTNDGTTNILVGRDSDEANVFWFDTNGYLAATGVSLSNNDSGTSNTIFGKNAGLSLDAGSNYNVFIGEGVSDAAMDDASSNVGIGHNALSALTTGDGNVAIGGNALNAQTTALSNVAIGQDVLKLITGGDSAGYNTVIGRYGLNALTASQANTSVGYGNLYAASSGNNNALFGHQISKSIADAWVTSCVNSIAVGSTAKFGDTTPINEILIGYNARGAGDNTTTIGNSSTTNTYLHGAVSADSYTADATAPAIAFTDSDTDDGDVSAQIYANATATGTGVEVVDMAFQAQGAVTAGTMGSFLTWDASAETLIHNTGTTAMSAVDVACADGDDTCAYDKTYQWHRLTSGADATGDTLTLPAGSVDGELRTFTLVVDGGDDVTIDVSTGTDTTLTTAGNSVDYMWDATNSTWWIK